MAACTPAQVAPPGPAQADIARAWQAGQHAVWSIDWPAAPVGGPLTAAVWRSGEQYRIEILEAVPPALVGEILVFNGKSAWRYNRFEPPPTLLTASPVLSPVSDLFGLIDRVLQTPAVAAEQERAWLNYSPAQNIRLTYPDGKRLLFWKDEKTGLPLRLVLWLDNQQITLQARRVEPLPQPAPELFEVGVWIYQ